MIEIQCLWLPVVPMNSVKSSYSLKSFCIPNAQIKKKKKHQSKKKNGSCPIRKRWKRI